MTRRSVRARRWRAGLAPLAAAVMSFVGTATAACPEAHPDPIGYVAAKDAENVCTEADVALVAQVANGTLPKPELEAKLKAQNEACASCAFSKLADPRWGLFVHAPDASTHVNFGSCFERAPGGTTECGRAVTESRLCIEARCRRGEGYCTDDSAYQECVDVVTRNTASCGQFDVIKACASYDETSKSHCADLAMGLKTLCGPATADAGGGDAGAQEEEDEEEPDSEDTTEARSGFQREPLPSSGCAQSGTKTAMPTVGVLIALAIVARAASRRRRRALR